VFDACAAKVGAAGSATAAAQAIKAGDTVVVPRMSVAHPFMARVAKVGLGCMLRWWRDGGGGAGCSCCTQQSPSS
jgi:hypothetical protein